MPPPPRLPLTPQTPIQYAHGVGPARAKQLESLGITRCGDLLTYFPRDYLKFEAQAPIAELHPGDMATAVGEVYQTRMHRGRPARFEAQLRDGTGSLTLTWFNPYGISDKVNPGDRLRVTGKLALYGGRLQMAQPKWEKIEPGDGDEAAVAGPRIDAVYAASQELPSNTIGRLMRENLPQVLPDVAEWLPEKHLHERHFFPRRLAFERIHLPRTMEEATKARRTLAYHEFLAHQVAVGLKRYQLRTSAPAIPLRVDDAVDARIRALLPFTLTAAQERVIGQIKKDIGGTRPMNRLLQGDVGSGKTVVALYAMLAAVAGGSQAALVAPTELVAEQHAITLGNLLKAGRVKTALLVGKMPEAQRSAIRAGLADGSIGLVIATHAILNAEVKFKQLGLVVIDEQHKFGVAQRATIRSKGAPHTLVMTATPIPRTLAMTAFGDLDYSVIDELPPGRHPVMTRLINAGNREMAYGLVAERLRAKEQAYVVLPTIDEGVLDLKSATGVHDELQNGWLKEFRIALLHGRMATEARQHVMERFRQGLIDVLVATTVIEVGVDVPNATVMVIEHAERFGLSQLHQLRGRIGRSEKKSVCLLIGEQSTEDSIARLRAMVKHSSGFKIAEEDLAIRGMGQLIGTAQSGSTDMHFADLLLDHELLGMARRDAQQIVLADPRLAAPQHAELRRAVVAAFGDTIGLADVG